MDLDYQFYQAEYQGDEISQEDFAPLAARAGHWLDWLGRQCRVSPPAGADPERSRALAVCAVAEQLHRRRQAESGELWETVSVGSVSTSRSAQLPAAAAGRWNTALARAAGQYLDICRWAEVMV